MRACVRACVHACVHLCVSVLVCINQTQCVYATVLFVLGWVRVLACASSLVVCRCVCTHTTLYSHSNRRVLCCRVASRLERYLDSLRAWTLERRTFFSQQQLTEFQTEQVRADLTLTFCEAASRLDSGWVTATVRGHVSAAIRRAALTGVCRGEGRRLIGTSLLAFIGPHWRE